MTYTVKILHIIFKFIYYLFSSIQQILSPVERKLGWEPKMCIGVLIFFVNRIHSISTTYINNTKLKLL